MRLRRHHIRSLRHAAQGLPGLPLTRIELQRANLLDENGRPTEAGLGALERARRAERAAARDRRSERRAED